MIRDTQGNVRQNHTHPYDHDFFDGPFTLTPHYVEQIPCDDFECFGELPEGGRDIRDLEVYDAR
jgi:hypothetical protein